MKTKISIFTKVLEEVATIAEAILSFERHTGLKNEAPAEAEHRIYSTTDEEHEKLTAHLADVPGIQVDRTAE